MRRFFQIILIFGLLQIARADTRSSISSAGTRMELDLLSVSDAVILGIVEGVTEFIPISSTGHLIAVTDFLRLDSNQPLFDQHGEPIWYEKPSSDGPGKLLTLNLATQSYIVVIQFGAIAAVLPVCWSQLMAMLRGLLGWDPQGRRLLINVLIAFVPSALVGLVAHDWIDDHLFSVDAVILALVVGSMLMAFAERWRRRSVAAGVWQERTELSPLAAAFIGFLQCIAMWPGMSRPMMTIVGGYFAGLSPARAAGFSFLLGFVTLNAAAIYKTIKNGEVIIQIFGWNNVLLGTVVAGVTAAISVRFFVKLLVMHGLSGFVWYRLALAIFLAFYSYG